MPSSQPGAAGRSGFKPARSRYRSGSRLAFVEERLAGTVHRPIHTKALASRLLNRDDNIAGQVLVIAPRRLLGIGADVASPRITRCRVPWTGSRAATIGAISRDRVGARPSDAGTHVDAGSNRNANHSRDETCPKHGSLPHGNSPFTGKPKLCSKPQYKSPHGHHAHQVRLRHLPDHQCIHHGDGDENERRVQEQLSPVADSFPRARFQF